MSTKLVVFLILFSILGSLMLGGISLAKGHACRIEISLLHKLFGLVIDDCFDQLTDNS